MRRISHFINGAVVEGNSGRCGPVYNPAEGKQTAEVDFASAAAVLFERNPMPAVTSRVCEHEKQCEGSCRRATTDGIVPIGAIERFVADWARVNRTNPSPVGESGKRVAVVGAGPSGLACAGELAKRGHEVTVYDAYTDGGGILRYGIPGHRLAKRIVDGEIEKLRANGVRFEFGLRIGSSKTLEELRASADAVYLGVGLGMPTTLDVPGETLEGVISASDYLERVNRPGGEDPTLRATSVVVIGGGNVAIDAARSARRLGAEQVSVVYRRSRAEMRVAGAEFNEAEREGIRFVYLAAPTAIVGDGNCRVRGLRCARMTLGARDASGRPRSTPSGEEFDLPADQVIVAIGSRAEAWVVRGAPRLVATQDGRPVVDERGATSTSRVFAGGDLVRGAATVVEAAADGIRAADAIDRALSAPSD